MSQAIIELCKTLIEERFGSIVAHIACLIILKPISIQQIIQNIRLFSKISLSPNMVKMALAVLEHHGYLEYIMDMENGPVVYTASAINVIKMELASRCMILSKALYGDIAEAIIEEMIAQGMLSSSDCLSRVVTRLDEKESRKTFSFLVEVQFLIRCPVLKAQFSTFDENITLFTVHDDVVVEKLTETPFISDSEEKFSRKRKWDAKENVPDSAILWRINWSRFDMHFRDELIFELITTAINNKCANVLRIVLQMIEAKVELATSSFPIAVHNVVRAAALKKIVLSKSTIEMCLDLLSDNEISFMRRTGDSAGGIYAMDFEKAVSAMCQSTIESIIYEKFDTKAVRIFRLLLNKGHLELEQEQIVKLAMLSAKEGKELTYHLMKEGFIFVREVAKTVDFTPARTFYLFHSNLKKTAQLLYMRSCKTLRNLILRHRFEVEQNKWLTERQMKMETILTNIRSDDHLTEQSKEEQMSDVKESYLTAADRSLLVKHNRVLNLLYCTRAALQRSIFIFQLYFISPNQSVRS